jgi:hypothetical protein
LVHTPNQTIQFQFETRFNLEARTNIHFASTSNLNENIKKRFPNAPCLPIPRFTYTRNNDTPLT